MHRSHVWLLLVAAALAGGGACDLFGEDLLSWDFALPEKEFTVNTDNFVPAAIKQLQPATMPTIACPTVDCCAGLAASECDTFGFACQTGACVAVPSVELSNSLNLAQEVPQLQSVASNIPSFTHVTLKRLYLASYSNTLNYDTPEIEIYLGPEAAASVDDVDQGGAPLCQKLGRLDPIPKGTSCLAGCAGLDVVLEPAAAQVFETFVRNFRQTFKLFVRATSQFEPGDPVPAGQFTATVTGTVTASM
ncbi:MAG: hypothetical protein HY906_18440 [Deltaproteobacteria bacterium]|nr:hypothetical protein [Deltaproteobacteria bacterium]